MSWFNPFFMIGLDGVNSTRKKLTKLQNNVTVQNIFFRNMEISTNRYTIKGLPDSCRERVVLQSLFTYACVCFFEYKGTLLALPSAPSGKGWNVNGDPLSACVYSKNGQLNEEIDLYIHGGYNDGVMTLGPMGTATKQNPKGVMVWENMSRYPMIREAIYYSERIADTLRTLDIDRKWLKRPFIPVGEDTIIPSIINMLKSIEDNDDLIPVDTGVMDIDKFNMLPVDLGKDTINAVVALCEWYENKYRELNGIKNNSQIDKKGENLITAEINVNDQYTDLSLDKILPVIEEGLDDVNKMFGTHITVERKQKKEVSRETLNGGEDNVENNE